MSSSAGGSKARMNSWWREDLPFLGNIESREGGGVLCMGEKSMRQGFPLPSRSIP